MEIRESGDALVGNGMVDELAAAARQAGLFSDEIAALEEASGEVEMAAAVDDLVRALTKALEAGKLLRAEEYAGVRQRMEALADIEEKEEGVLNRLEDIHSLQAEIGDDRPFDATADSARRAADEIDRATQAMSEYHKSRVQGAGLADDFPSTPAVAKEGLRNFIAWLEGTAVGSHPRAKGYNTTLDYDRYTGPQNLVGMTLNEVQALQRQMLAHPDNPHNSSAVGMYQIVGTTLRGLIREMGLTGNELFSAKLQDQMADRLIARRGRDAGGLRSEWEGLNRAGDADILAAYDADRGDREQSLAEAATRSAEAARERAATLREVVAVGEQQLEQLRLEASLAGRSVEEQARLTFEYEALARAKQQGIDVDKELVAGGRTLRQVIEEQAVNWGRLAAAEDAAARSSDAAREKQRELADELSRYEDDIRGLFDNLKPGGAGIEAFWDDLGNMIIDKLWAIVLDPVWEALATAMQGLFSGGGGAVGGGVFAALFADGGGLPKRAGGGGFSGTPRAVGMLEGSGGKRQDNLLFWGSRGEFMQPAAAVDHYGVEFMEAIRTRRLPKFANGGMIGGSSMSGSNGAPAVQPIVNMPVSIETLPGETAEITRTPDGGMNIRMVRQFMRDELASGSMDGAMRRRYGGRPLPKGS